MIVTVVGCSGSVPGPASPASCYLVEAADASGRTWRLVLDMGSGSLGALQRYCDPLELDALALSHLHPDHCADAASLGIYLTYHPDGTGAPMRVYGPFGTGSRLAAIAGGSDPHPLLEVTVLQSGGQFEVGPMRITAEPVAHPVPAYALRIEGPSERPARASAVLAYSGDTDRCDGLDVVSAGADVLLCEATFLEAADAPKGIHLTAADAGEVAERAAVDRLVLTHVPPWTDPNEVLAQAASRYTGSIELARPGLRMVL